MPIIDDNVLINGTLEIKAKPNQHAIKLHAASDDHYPMVTWVDAQGQFMAGIVAHLKTHEGDTHGHLSIYLADPTAKNGRRSKIDMQFDKEVSTLSLEGVMLFVKDKLAGLVVRDEANGKPYTLGVNGGKVVAKPCPLNVTALNKPGKRPNAPIADSQAD